MAPKLTFGFPTISDPNAWMTLNAFKLMHGALRAQFDVEIVIVDNSKADCKISAEFHKHVKANHPDVVYIRDTGPPSSCLYKSRVFEHATGDIVICVDSHVMLAPGCVENVMSFFTANPESIDLLTGPCLNSADKLVATNQHLFADEPYELPKSAVVKYGYVCRGGQLGTWVTDPRGLDVNNAPFIIRMNGTGFLAMRREAYPGFPDNLWGFGGCEPALYRRIESAGGRVLCHPGCRWVHNFSTEHGRGYVAQSVDKVRNYIVSATAIGDDNMKMAAMEHFAAIHPEAIGPAIVEASQIAAGTFKPTPAYNNGTCQKGACANKKEASAKQVAVAGKTAGTTEEPKGVYGKYIKTWKEMGGDVGGACPAPLFVSLAHLKPTTWANEDGTGTRPIKSIEFGCGLSTLAFDRQGLQHTAIEHDDKWIQKVLPLLTKESTKIIHAPIKDGWYDWKPEFGALYDVILIDGPPGTIGREKCVEVVPSMLAPNGIIFIDDTHREVEQRISKALAEKLGMQIRTMKHGARKYDILTPNPAPLGEGPGTELVRIFKEMKMPTCQQCHELARKMNEWGAEGSWNNMEYIVEDMLPRARGWWVSSSPWMKGESWFKSSGSMWEKLTELRKAAKGKLTGDMDNVLRDSIRVHVAAAIKAAKEKAATPEQTPVQTP